MSHDGSEEDGGEERWNLTFADVFVYQPGGSTVTAPLS